MSKTEKQKDLQQYDLPNYEVVGYNKQGDEIRRPVPKVKFDMRDLTIWSYHVSGMMQKDIAALLGVHHNTVSTRLKRMLAMMETEIDRDQLRNGLLRLFPVALASVANNLAAGDVLTTNQYLKGVGAYQDPKAGDTNINVTVNVEEKRLENQRIGLSRLGFDLAATVPDDN